MGNMDCNRNLTTIVVKMARVIVLMIVVKKDMVQGLPSCMPWKVKVFGLTPLVKPTDNMAKPTKKKCN